MEIIDISNPISVLLILGILIGMIFLGKSLKMSKLPVSMLVVFLGLLIYYAVLLGNPDLESTRTVVINCISIDLIFIFISFIAYLWVDDLEAKKKNKKSVSDALDWLWGNAKL